MIRSRNETKRARKSGRRRRRCYHELILDILELCCRPTKYTKILDYAYINSKVFENVVPVLVDSEFLQKQENSYETTFTGQLWMKRYRELQKMLSEFPDYSR